MRNLIYYQEMQHDYYLHVLAQNINEYSIGGISPGQLQMIE